MRKIVFLMVAVISVAASPVWARAHHHRIVHRVVGRHSDSFSEARRIILSRELLTPAQLACSLIVRGTKAAGQVVQVSVLRKDVPGCREAEARSLLRFDLYMDNASQSYQWTPDGPGDLKEVPYLRDVRRVHERGTVTLRRLY